MTSLMSKWQRGRGGGGGGGGGGATGGGGGGGGGGVATPKREFLTNRTRNRKLLAAYLFYLVFLFFLFLFCFVSLFCLVMVLYVHINHKAY